MISPLPEHPFIFDYNTAISSLSWESYNLPSFLPPISLPKEILATSTPLPDSEDDKKLSHQPVYKPIKNRKSSLKKIPSSDSDKSIALFKEFLKVRNLPPIRNRCPLTQYLKAPDKFVSFFGGSNYYRTIPTPSNAERYFRKKNANQNDYEIYVTHGISSDSCAGFIYVLNYDLKKDPHFITPSNFFTRISFIILDDLSCILGKTSNDTVANHYFSFKEIQKNLGLRSRLPPDPEKDINGVPYVRPPD